MGGWGLGGCGVSCRAGGRGPVYSVMGDKAQHSRECSQGGVLGTDRRAHKGDAHARGTHECCTAKQRGARAGAVHDARDIAQ